MPFLLDTNVVSELRRKQRAHPNVIKWQKGVSPEEIYISVIVLGEMRRGIELKRRKDAVAFHALEKWLREIEVVYRSRILDVDKEICDIWGRFMVDSQLSPMDGLIAATAVNHGLTVATRNTADFQRCGVDYINPFES